MRELSQPWCSQKWDHKLALWAFGFGGAKFAQPFYTIDTFPYDNAITSWTNEKTRKGVLALVAHWSK